MQELWAARLRQDLAAYSPGLHGTYLKSKNSKWRVVSALQKAIRRGDVLTAQRMAHALHGHDAAYLWRRLCTVVMEDVGLGDIDLVARFLWVATRPGWRAENGGELACLYLLVQQMCEAPKDRNACDLPGWGEMDPDLAGHRAACEALDLDRLLEVLVDPSAPPVNRCLVFQYLGHFQHPAFAKAQGFKAALTALRETGTSELLLEIARMGRSKQLESQPYAFPFLWEIHAASPTVAVEPDDLTAFPLVGPFPSSAYDRHCREGMRCLRRWYAACKPLREALGDCVLVPDDPEAHRWALEALLFRVEGHQVDRRLVYEGSREIDVACRRAHLCHNYVPPRHQALLLELTRQHLHELDRIRRDLYG